MLLWQPSTESVSWCCVCLRLLGFYFNFKYKSEERLALHYRLFWSPCVFCFSPGPSLDPFSTTHRKAQTFGSQFFPLKAHLWFCAQFQGVRVLGGFPQPLSESLDRSWGSTIQFSSATVSRERPQAEGSLLRERHTCPVAGLLHHWCFWPISYHWQLQCPLLQVWLIC